MSESAEGAVRFECTPKGVIAKGQRRLTALLVGLSLGMVAVAVAVWVSGRIFPGILALAVAAMAFVAWRMSCELHLEWIEIGSDTLTLRAVHQQIKLAVESLSARSLDGAEIEHLERLASAGGIVAGSGGFDSHLLGEFDLYATNLNNAVLIESNESRLVVTPDRPEEFLQLLDERQRALTAHS